MTMEIGSLRVLRGSFQLGPLSATLTPGVTALVGPNGAGKTTLMSAILGLLSATGEVAISGHATRGGSRPKAMAVLGYLPQNPQISRLLTVKQAVSYAAWLKRVDDVPHAVAEALARVDLTELTVRRVGRLSGGQVQRACIAQAVVHNPTVLLMDEPSVGLDPQQRKFLYDVIRNLAAEGATVLVSTHNMDDVSAVADRVLVINHGQLVADEPLDGTDAAMRFSAVNELVSRTLGYAR